MSVPNQSAIWKWSRIALTIVVVAVAAVTFPRWWGALNQWVADTVAARGATAAGGHDHGHGSGDSHDSHDHHGHDHAGHDESESLELSEQARRNIGLTDEYVRPVTLQTFRRSMTVPAIVTERTGRTRIRVATPLTGLVTRIYAVPGEAVRPGTLLFDIRLTHEDLVQTQTEFLQALGELDVETREIARLREVSQSGAVPGRLILERQYAKERLEALLTAQREALRLHGLSDRQVQEVEEKRRLLRELHITVPEPEKGDSGELQLTARSDSPFTFISTETADDSSESPLLVLQELLVHRGQAVKAGEDLCVVADYRELYIEGQAFERDAAAIARAQQQGWFVTAEFESPGGGETVDALKIAFLSNEVDVDSRTLSFYVNLPNEIIRDQVNNRSQRFISWKYRPGQRLKLHVPVEEWKDQIVVPVEAVAHEGAEYYVFQENGDHFDRVAVHVKYRDRNSVVIANDGSIFPGDVIAMRGAHQMQMALKNKAGGAIDPHAGHNH